MRERERDKETESETVESIVRASNVDVDVDVVSAADTQVIMFTDFPIWETVRKTWPQVLDVLSIKNH